MNPLLICENAPVQRGSPFRWTLFRESCSPSILCIGLLLTISCFAKSQEPNSQGLAKEGERLIGVSTMELHLSASFQKERQFTGQIEPKRKSQLGFDRIGRVAEIMVEKGDEVRLGEPIAILDSDSLLAQRRKLEADLASARALLREVEAGPREETILVAKASLEEQQSQLNFANEVLKRRARLLEKKLVAREEWEQAVANRERLTAAVDGASNRLKDLELGTRKEKIESQASVVDAISAAIEQVNVEVKKSKLVSPFDGKVLQRDLDEGSIVSPGRPVVTIVEHKKLEARVGVATGFAKKIVKGTKLPIEVEGVRLEGQVRAIVSEIDPNTRTQALLLSLDDNAWEKVVPGDTVRVSLSQEATASGYWVPTESLVVGPRGLWNCFVIEQLKSDGTGVAAIRTVELVHSNGERSLITGSINDGELLIDSAPHRVIAGQRVRALTKADTR